MVSAHVDGLFSFINDSLSIATKSPIAHNKFQVFAYFWRKKIKKIGQTRSTQNTYTNIEKLQEKNA